LAISDERIMIISNEHIFNEIFSSEILTGKFLSQRRNTGFLVRENFIQINFAKGINGSFEE